MYRKIGILCAGDSELAPFLPHLEHVRTSEKALLREIQNAWAARRDETQKERETALFLYPYAFYLRRRCAEIHYREICASGFSSPFGSAPRAGIFFL